MSGQPQPRLHLGPMMAGVQHTPPEDPNPLPMQAAEEGPALSSHQAAVPCANCGSRRFTNQIYFSMYAWTTGFSPDGRSSSTGGSSVATN